ncbi:hypothetical protein NG895_26005 [Aeoliella sp. ICT_H6.2]|uniref:Uncharacterized protein n=1 Tax=Aeoliella straminimaris TaxID=2954799 RepID=A0A9X2FJK9_9BACT|nr:hypothetical protein [Aeoliella straminimaris]MCO6047371.1 hypothetical protein [Aeoliella straminimaris]
MDDQATKLRQLVRTVRHAATVATGPPLLMAYSPVDAADTQQVYRAMVDACADRNLRLATSTQVANPPDPIDWQLVQVVGDYQLADHELWSRASALIVVVHDDDESVVECYKRLKVAHQHTPLPPMELVVLCEEHLAEVDLAADRLAQTCQRFLHSSVAGQTVLDGRSRKTRDAIATLVERLLMMAPVATSELNSPIAAHQPYRL